MGSRHESGLLARERRHVAEERSAVVGGATSEVLSRPQRLAGPRIELIHNSGGTFEVPGSLRTFAKNRLAGTHMSRGPWITLVSTPRVQMSFVDK